MLVLPKRPRNGEATLLFVSLGMPAWEVHVEEAWQGTGVGNTTSKPQDGLAQLHAMARACCAALVCVLKGIWVLKHREAEPPLDHRGSGGFNYSTRWGQYQLAGMSVRRDVYSCLHAPGRKKEGMRWGQGVGCSPPSPSGYFVLWCQIWVPILDHSPGCAACTLQVEGMDRAAQVQSLTPPAWHCSEKWRSQGAWISE